MQKDLPRVAIVMGSESDKPDMKNCKDILDALFIPSIARVISAHRTPRETVDFAQGARERGFSVIIAGAGASAALPGVIAAHTSLPVIGVPLNATSLGGLDALLSIAQMPQGVPVATMGIGAAGAKNAAFFTARILSLVDEGLKTRLEQFMTQAQSRAREKTTVDAFL